MFDAAEASRRFMHLDVSPYVQYQSESWRYVFLALGHVSNDGVLLCA